MASIVFENCSLDNAEREQSQSSERGVMPVSGFEGGPGVVRFTRALGLLDLAGGSGVRAFEDSVVVDGDRESQPIAMAASSGTTKRVDLLIPFFSGSVNTDRR
jgi:hypothetical protein